MTILVTFPSASLTGILSALLSSPPPPILGSTNGDPLWEKANSPGLISLAALLVERTEDPAKLYTDGTGVEGATLFTYITEYLLAVNFHR